MIHSLLQIELLKLAKRPMTWVMLLLQLGVLGLGFFTNALSLRSAAPERQEYLLRALILPDSLGNTTQFIYLFGAILLALLTAAAIGGEYSWGTLRQALATGVSRTGFLGAKLLALAIVAAAFVVLPLLVTVPISLWIAWLEQRPALAAALDPAWLAALLGRTYLLVLMPMSLAFLIALVARSQAVGVGAALGLLIVDQIAAPILWSIGTDWALALVEFFPFWCARSLLVFNFTSPPADLPNTIGQGRAILTLAIYCLVCIGAGVLIFRRRDVGGPV